MSCSISSMLQRRSCRLVTSHLLRAPHTDLSVPRTLLTTRRSFSTTAPHSYSSSAPPPSSFTPSPTTPPTILSSAESSSSTPPPPPPPLPPKPSSTVRYLIVSVASLALGVMLATVSEPLSHLNTLRKSSDSLHTLLNTTHTPPTLPASAPVWATQLATNPAFDYKDVTAVFPTANHLIYDSLRADKRVQHVYHFITKKDATTADTQPEVHVLFELGTALCGHAGIVHGGLTASLIDQISGETTFLSTGPGSFTANLNVNYMKPLIAGRWVEVVGRVVSVEGRKIRVKVDVMEGGSSSSEAEGKVLYASGDVLFVRPKWIPEQTSEWKISANSVQQAEQQEKAKQQNILKSG